MTRGRIIKAADMPTAAVEKFRPDDAIQAVEKKVAEANEQIRDYQTQAESNVQKVYDEASAAGYKAGFEKGQKDAVAQQEGIYGRKLEQELADRLSPAQASVQSAIERIGQFQEEWINRWDSLGMDLICSIASRVVRRLINQDSEVARRTLREVLTLVAQSPKIVVYLNPDDYETIQSNPTFWRPYISRAAEIEMHNDPSLSRGGCRVETEHAAIDASIETQLSKLIEELIGHAPSDSTDPNPA